MRVEMANMARMAATACLEVGQIPHLLLERGSVTISIFSSCNPLSYCMKDSEAETHQPEI